MVATANPTGSSRKRMRNDDSYVTSASPTAPFTSFADAHLLQVLQEHTMATIAVSTEPEMLVVDTHQAESAPAVVSEPAPVQEPKRSEQPQQSTNDNDNDSDGDGTLDQQHYSLVDADPDDSDASSFDADSD
jgi:hypothetical protein